MQRTTVREADTRFQSTTAWALAYLRGRAMAYVRGAVTARNVNGTVRLAFSRGASVADVRGVLHQFLLEWDEQSETVVPR
jgi:hypothetical protein